MGGERAGLDGQADDFRYHLERAEPGSALEECARWGLALVTELRVARKVVEVARQAVPIHVGTTKALGRLHRALRAYDQATSP